MEIPMKNVSANSTAAKKSMAATGFFKKNSPTGKPASSAENPIGLNRQSDTMAMKIIDRIVKISIYLTVFLFPLFFLSSVPSVLELNKQLLLVALVGIGFLAWVGKMAWKNEIRFKKSFILVPIVTFLAIYGFSTAFSIYTEQSMWGYFGGESKSFVAMLFMVALFLLVSNNIKTRKEAIMLILVLLGSGFISGLYGLLQLYGKFIIPSDVTKSPFFNTVGSVYLFGVFIAAMLLMTLSLFLDRISKVLKIVLVVLCFFFFFILMIINFAWIWKGLLISIALLFAASIIKSGSSENQSRILPMIFLVLILLMLLRSQPVIKKEMPVEVLLNRKTSMQIAFKSLKQNPMLGTGPATYVNVYEKNRPENLGDFWSINFNDSSSYFFTLMSTTGVLGTLSFLFLIGAGVMFLLKGLAKAISDKKSSDFMVIGVGTVWFFLTIVLFVYLANMAILTLWWLALALFISFMLFDPNSKAQEFITSSQTPRSSLTLSFVFVLVIIGFIAAIYLETQKYVAAVQFNGALLADAKGEDIDKVKDGLFKAVETDSNRDIYYRNLSVALFAMANKRVADKNGQELTADDSNYVSSMIKGSLQAADRSAALNSKDPSNYIALAGVYEGVLATMDQADQRAIDNYEKAIELDPQNVALYQKIASIYVTLSDIEISKQMQQQKGQKLTELPEKSKQNLAKAKDYLERALKLKTDYPDANLLLASVYERQGEMDKAIEKEKENKSLYAGAPGISFRLGLLYYKNNQLEEAKSEFEDAVLLDKNYSNARYFLGLIYDKLKDKKAATEQFEKIAELNPDNEDLKKIVENLKAGKDALAGLEQNQDKAPIKDEGGSQQQSDGQPGINPSVENQDIPRDATPKPEDVDRPKNN